MSLGEVCVLLLEVQAGLGESTSTLESLHMETGTGIGTGIGRGTGSGITTG